jgi:hypothetical protein
MFNLFSILILGFKIQGEKKINCLMVYSKYNTVHPNYLKSCLNFAIVMNFISIFIIILDINVF